MRCQSSPGTIDHSINIRFIFRFSISIFIIFISIISIVGLKPDAIDPIIDHHRSWRHTAGIIGNVGFCRHIGNVGFQPDAHSDAHNDDAATDAHSDTGTDAASASATASAPSVTSGFNPTRRNRSTDHCNRSTPSISINSSYKRSPCLFAEALVPLPPFRETRDGFPHT